MSILTDVRKIEKAARNLVAKVSKETAKGVVLASPDPTHARQRFSRGSYIQSVNVSVTGVEDTSFVMVPKGTVDITSRAKANKKVRALKQEDFTLGVDVIISNNVPHADSVEFGIGWETQREYAPMRLGFTKGLVFAEVEAGRV